jgi:hypothetical protein
MPADIGEFPTMSEEFSERTLYESLETSSIRAPPLWSGGAVLGFRYTHLSIEGANDLSTV